MILNDISEIRENIIESAFYEILDAVVLLIQNSCNCVRDLYIRRRNDSVSEYNEGKFRF